MERPAPVDHAVHELVRQRWSPLAFADRPVHPGTLASLFEAARWAPSSYNEQPWAFVYARREDAADFERILATLAEGNQAWARNAPVLLIACSKRAFDRTGEPNRHAGHDTGAALAWLNVQAEAMGLRVHLMAGFDTEKARRDLAIPAGWDPITAGALGFPGRTEQLPEALRSRETGARTRKPQSAFVFKGAWNTPAGLDDATRPR